MFSHFLKDKNKSHIASPTTTSSETFHEFDKGHLFEEKLANILDHSDYSQMIANNQDTRNAMWYYLRAALRGDKDAQYKMGVGYLNGQLGLDRSYLNAEKWLEQAAHHGHQQAQTELQNALNRLAFS